MALGRTIVLLVCASLGALTNGQEASLFVLPFDRTPAVPLGPVRPVAGDAPLAPGGADAATAADAAGPAAAAAAASGAVPVKSAPMKRIKASRPRLAASPAGAAVLAAAAAAAAAPSPSALGGCDGVARVAESGETCCNCDSLVTPPPPTAEQDRAANRTASQRPKFSRSVAAAVAPIAKGYSANGIAYAGGSVMYAAAKVHLIWYGYWTATGKQLVRDFVTGLGNSDLHATQTTYGDTQGRYVRKSLQLGGESTYTTYSFGKSLSDSAVEQLVVKTMSISGGPLPSSTNDMYMLMTGPEVTQVASDGSKFCTTFCGWHTDLTGPDGKRYVYGWNGNPGIKCPSDCGAQDMSPNGDPGVENQISTLAHEIWESQTDPWSNGWGADGDNQENADKCAETTGRLMYTPAGAPYNVVLGSRKWLIQTLWMNWNGGYCASSGSLFTTAFAAATNALYLTSQAPGCPPSAALGQFKLESKVSGSSASARYGYTCPPIDYDRIGSPQRYVTARAPDGSGNARFLDRHNVTCPSGSVIQKWHVTRPTAVTIAFEYWCVSLAGTFSCAAPQSTASATDGGGSVLYLDRHNVACPAGKYLSWFKLSRPTDSTFRYDFRCCGV